MALELIATFTGDTTPPLIALRRPTTPRRVHRVHEKLRPDAWDSLWQDAWGVEPRYIPAAWNAFSACRYTEVQQLVALFLGWRDAPRHYRELEDRGIPPARLLKALELLVIDGKLYTYEASILEAAVLRHVNATGLWL